MIYAFLTLFSSLYIASLYMPPKPWPNKTLYYAYDDKLPENFKFETQIAIAYWKSVMPDLQFLPKVEGKSFVLIHPVDDTEACWVDGVGYYPHTAEREMALGPNCDVSAIIHEFGHLLGLQHEHQRPDRDEYVTVNWSCIPFSDWGQYVIIPWTGYLDGPYDLESVMHYAPSPPTNKCPRIEMLPGKHFIPSVTPTPQDVEKLRHIYPR